jgi:hypothetical protein
MKPREQELARAWFRNWEKVSPVLDALRSEDIRNAETAEAIAAFDGLFETAVRDLPARLESGLVEQQKLYKLARK